MTILSQDKIGIKHFGENLMLHNPVMDKIIINITQEPSLNTADLPFPDS
jgi:hypothetical protein